MVPTCFGLSDKLYHLKEISDKSERWLELPNELYLEHKISIIVVRGEIFVAKKMVKRKKEFGKHSSPETSGVQNLTDYHIEKYKGKGSDKLEEIMGIYKQGIRNSQEYKGLWSDEELEREINAYFAYIVLNEMKPAKAGLRLWLGISKSQYYEWETNPKVYRYKSNLINMANTFMELEYISKVESYPTGNIFLLKSSHGHVDKSEVNITATTDVSQENILDTVNKLGLTGEVEK